MQFSIAKVFKDKDRLAIVKPHLVESHRDRPLVFRGQVTRSHAILLNIGTEHKTSVHTRHSYPRGCAGWFFSPNNT